VVCRWLWRTLRFCRVYQGYRACRTRSQNCSFSIVPGKTYPFSRLLSPAIPGTWRYPSCSDYWRWRNRKGKV